MTGSVDLAAYFARIGYCGPSEPGMDLLRALHARHPAAIAFESLDPFLGRPVDLDPAAIQAKLVHTRRGGYCQEHNALFHDVLGALGFSVTALGGRVVWLQPGRSAPLTHRLTLIDMAEGRFIADVGFGGQSLTAPLRLEPDMAQQTPDGTYRLQLSGDVYELQMLLGARWEGMYRFTLAPQAPIDFQVANWFTSTHPRGRFVQNLVAARVVGADRYMLINRFLSVRHPDGTVVQRALTGPDDLRDALEQAMDLALPVSAETIWPRLPEQLLPAWPVPPG